METIAQAVTVIEQKLVEHKAGIKLMTETEVKTVSDALAALKNTEVKALTDDLAAKGATILEMQGEIKELKAKRARPGAGGGERRESIMSRISDMIVEKKDLFIAASTGGRVEGNMEIKAVGPILSTSLANGSYIDYLDWRPGMEPTGQTRIREFVRTLASAFDTVNFPRANTPVGQGSFGRQVTEGTQKAQVDRGYTMQTLNLTPMAGWVTVSRQSLRNIPFLQTWLPTSLNEQLLDTEDTEFSGLIVAAATGNNSVSGKTVAIEQLIYLVKNSIQAKYRPTAIAMDPNVWAEILVTKPQNYSTPLGVTVDAVGTVRILGIPAYPVNWLTGNRCIVADWTRIAIVESEGLSFRQSDNVASQFTANEITFLLERTDGLAIFRPDAIITAVLASS